MSSWRPYGRVRCAGRGADLLSEGWLPRRLAAAVLDMSLGDFDRLVEEGLIATRVIGPGAVLFEVSR